MSTTTPRPTRTRPPVITLISGSLTTFSFPSGSPSNIGFTSTRDGSGGGGGGGNNRGRNTASNASLYLYTFLATLILLLSVTAAIVARSFILRRRHRRMVQEAIRNGTWLPSQDDDDLNGGIGGGFGGTRRVGGRVDLSKRPKMWDTYLGAGFLDSGGYAREKGASYGSLKKDGSGDGTVAKEWDTIKPVSVSYVAASPLPAGKSAAVRLDTASGVSDEDAHANSGGQQHGDGEVQRRSVLRRAGTFIADLFRPPRPQDAGTSSNLYAPNTPQPSVQQRTRVEQENGTGMKVIGGQRVRVAVLISMPSPPSDPRHLHTPGSSPDLASSSSSDAHTTPLPLPHGQTQPQPHAHPLSFTIHPPLAPPADEQSLPVLELGVAEVLVTAEETDDIEEGVARMDAKFAKEVKGRDTASFGEAASVNAGVGGVDGVGTGDRNTAN